MTCDEEAAEMAEEERRHETERMRRKRGTIRGATTRILNQIDVEISQSNPDTDHLSTLLELLSAKEDSLFELDRGIEQLTPLDGLEAEIACTEDYKERVIMLKSRAQRVIKKNQDLNPLPARVADIKRVNNLIQEQDIFALKSIKIPVKKHSLLTEANAELMEPDPGTSNSATPLPQPQGKLTASSPGRPHLQEYTDYLKEVDHDIERLIQTTNAQDEVFLEAAERPQKLGSRGQRLTSYGADWGIQWWNAVVAMLLIGIILPVFYVVYIKTSNSSGTGLSTDSPRSTFSSQESVSLSLNKPNT